MRDLSSNAHAFETGLIVICYCYLMIRDYFGEPWRRVLAEALLLNDFSWPRGLWGLESTTLATTAHGASVCQAYRPSCSPPSPRISPGEAQVGQAGWTMYQSWQREVSEVLGRTVRQPGQERQDKQDIQQRNRWEKRQQNSLTSKSGYSVSANASRNINQNRTKIRGGSGQDKEWTWARTM
jgi:hypothetical protein